LNFQKIKYFYIHENNVFKKWEIVGFFTKFFGGKSQKIPGEWEIPLETFFCSRPNFFGQNKKYV
jgi:hypothetical protein